VQVHRVLVVKPSEQLRFSGGTGAVSSLRVNREHKKAEREQLQWAEEQPAKEQSR
jgi:hypothetical protein